MKKSNSVTQCHWAIMVTFDNGKCVYGTVLVL
jgi:hypothetical protein